MATQREFNVDAVYPEPLSRQRPPFQHRRAERRSRAASGRYRTQPVTFAEIKEVDEESLPSESLPSAAVCSSEVDLLQASSRRPNKADDAAAPTEEQPIAATARLLDSSCRSFAGGQS